MAAASDAPALSSCSTYLNFHKAGSFNTNEKFYIYLQESLHLLQFG